MLQLNNEEIKILNRRGETGLKINSKISKSKNPICGVKVICAGRWKKTKSGRKQKFTLYKGKLAMQSYSSFLDFGFYHGNTKFGSFSFKVLVAYNQ